MGPPLFDSLPNESTRNTSVFTERIHPNVTRSTLAVKKVAKASNISSLSECQSCCCCGCWLCIVARRRWFDGGIVVGGSGATYPTNVTSTLYTYIQAQNYMGPKAENTKQEATAKNARGPLYTLIYTLQPEGLGADTKSICMAREQPKNAVLFGWLFQNYDNAPKLLETN